LTRELYIYWRVNPADVQSALAAVASMQAALRRRHSNLSARLLQRNNADKNHPGASTVMEIYTCAGAGGIDAAMQAEIETSAAVLARYVRPEPDGPGRRHTEVFEVCGDGAGLAPTVPPAV
jgi:hypothetical protein